MRPPLVAASPGGAPLRAGHLEHDVDSVPVGQRLQPSGHVIARVDDLVRAHPTAISSRSGKVGGKT